jgi:hypothetical protein
LITSFKPQTLYRGYRGPCPSGSYSPGYNPAIPALDTEYPVGSKTLGVLFSVHSPNDTMIDSPGFGLPNTDGERAEVFNAITYLMWTPTADSNCTDGALCTVPVPLGSLSWNFQGDTINTLQQNSSNTTWIPNYRYPSSFGQEQISFSPGGSYPQVDADAKQWNSVPLISPEVR